MNSIVFGIVYGMLILMLIICAIAALFGDRNSRLSDGRRGKFRTKKRKTKTKKNTPTPLVNLKPAKKVNAYAVCRSMQKKYGWSEEKTKRCIEQIKEKEGN